jgi:hypothetical protein
LAGLIAVGRAVMPGWRRSIWSRCCSVSFWWRGEAAMSMSCAELFGTVLAIDRQALLQIAALRSLSLLSPAMRRR